MEKKHKNKGLMSHAAIILPVKDLKTSEDFYQNKLGFELTFEWGEPPYYAGLKRGDYVGIHLTARKDDVKTHANHTALYVFTSHVDALYEEFRNAGVPIHNPLTEWEYGMRDFDIKDPDGYILSFGQGVE